MKKAKVLFISQEITPFLELTEISKIARHLPQGIQEKGKEIRTFMPRFGLINERRNQLHEVIRLSGMNLIIDDSDHPLIIKVASIQSARMQVYFIDNEEYFQRKSIFRDAKKKFYKDNEDRMVFFCRGVLETVKKLGWAPDVIHCHGWMTSLIPYFVKTGYKDDPMFKNSRVVYSSYYQELEETMSPNLIKKLKMDGNTPEEAKLYKDPTMVNVDLAAMKLCDGIIKGSDEKNTILDNYLKKANKPVLNFQALDDEGAFVSACSDFYDELLEQEPVLAD
jgi:starch synthase